MKTIYLLIALAALVPVIEASGQASQTTDIMATTNASEESVMSVGTRYYYYPNLDAYFDSHENLYIFEQQGQWVKSKELKSGYRGYSIMNNVRVAITDYNGDMPYSKISDHRKQFPKNFSSKRKPPKLPQAESKVALN